MKCVHRPVVPAVSVFLVVLYGIGTLEPAQAQSTGKLKKATTFFGRRYVSLERKIHNAAVICIHMGRHKVVKRKS